MREYAFFMVMCFLCNPINSFSTEKVSNKKIVIIGAGLAGLTAGYRLYEKGFDVTIYEARNRVGGRILSAFVNDNIVELGGENFADGGAFEHINQLVDELGIDLICSESPVNRFFHHNNIFVPIRELIAQQNFDLEVLQKKLHTMQKTSVSMRDILEQIFPSDSLLKTCFSTALAGYEGASAAELSSLYTQTLYHMIRGGVCHAHQDDITTCIRIKGGNSVLPQALAAKLGDRVCLGMPIISIITNKQNQYVLTCKDGSIAIADILVLAIPCPVYHDIIFGENVIPTERLVSIKSIQNGSNAKIIVPIANNIVTSTSTILMNDHMGIYSFIERMVTLYFRGQSSKFESDTIAQQYALELPILACGFGIDALPRQEPVIACDEPFACYSGPVGYSWPSDLYAKGSYSYIGVGQDELLTTLQKYDGFIVKKLFSPIDHQLYFAGEHASTLPNILGTMEAACQSGTLVANMIENSGNQL